ncbi:hypothetical protein [Legionella oakridgensis]|uniref:Uncharacterized protein n=1 Tax=Legionella oakridgensis TaxID=29423 RepID=A0A0W0WZR0_9GAMM|nr:hypothetical protein [Legionella oakridgensis]KTD37801.1 hypothetical protein Loak_1477 [Legionella oakridgensis]STY19746.1 Uncharacterised protein [Legionella longbeachae]
MSSIIDTLQCFIESLQKKDTSLLHNRMNFYDRNMVVFNDDFHKTAINKNKDIQVCVQQLLMALDIPSSKWGRYLNAPLTVYDFLQELQELTRHEHEEINEFIKLITEKGRNKKRKILIGGSLLLFALSFLPPFLVTGGLTALQSLLAASLFFPVIGLIYTVGIGIYSFYQSFSEPNVSLSHRFRENFSLLASSALNLAAYGVLIAAATTMNPIAAALFVAASLVSVFNEVFHLVLIWNENRKSGPITEQDSLEVRQEKTRIANEYARCRNNVVIALGASIVLAGIITVWSFVPGGIFVSIGILAAIAVVYGLKKLCSFYNDKRMKAHLVQEFEALEYAEEEKARLRAEILPEMEVSPTETASIHSEVFSSTFSQTRIMKSGFASRDGLFSSPSRRISLTDGQELQPILGSAAVQAAESDGHEVRLDSLPVRGFMSS